LRPDSTRRSTPRDQVHAAVAVKVHDHDQVNVSVNDRIVSSRVPRISGQALTTLLHDEQLP